MIPFYTQGQNYPFSSWQSRNFGIYPKNVKVAPSFYISLRTAFPPGISGMSVPQPALHYKTRGRQGRTNAALHVPFQAGASARRNNAAFHGMFRIGMMFLRPLLISLPCLFIPGRLWQGQTVIRFHDGQRSGTPEFLPVMESEESPLCLPRQTLVRPARPYLNPPSFTYLLYTSRLSPYIVSRVLLSAGHAVRICRTQRSVIVS